MAKTKGANHISISKKGAIVAAHNVDFCATSELAKMMGVSETSIRNIVKPPIPPEVQAKADLFDAYFATYADANALHAQEQVFNNIKFLTADKASKVAETQFNLGRTWRGETTTHSQITQTPEQLARELYAHLLAQHFEQSVILEVVQENFPDVPAERLLISGGSKPDE